MATVKDLRNNCQEMRKQFLNEEKQIHELRRNEVVAILNDWLELFISDNHVWLATAGNKRCIPIPIHRYFSKDQRLETTYAEYKEERYWDYDFLWPDLPEKEILEIVSSLGFLIYGDTLDRMALAVPPYEEGRSLTFAQKWVRKINHNYSEYIAAERKKAKYCYRDFVFQLYDTSMESIEIRKEYVLFRDFKFKTPMSLRCAQYIRAFMHRDGIKELREDGKYKGTCVFYETP